MAESRKYVFSFGDNKAEGDATMRNELGGKGANLCEMVRLGIPVPPGFVISTEVCVHFFKNNWTYPFGLREQVDEALKRIEITTNKLFGDRHTPLLVSVRSGARASMPGMMDTILNLGLNEQTVQGLVEMTGDEHFAYDSYRRFIHMYSDVVLGIVDEDESPFEAILDQIKKARDVKADFELSAADLKEIVHKFKELVKERTGKSFPESPAEQLWGAIGAVFRSWMNERAIEYRKMYHIPEEWGTAVNIVGMVYGNLAENSGTGVAFTRNPATGENKMYGEYLMNAQGEDVVAGTRTPITISQLQNEMPPIYDELHRIATTLEKHYRDMQDIEFTIERGKLWMLQCRTGKRTGMAAMRIAIEMVESGLINEREALMRVDPNHLNQLLQPLFDLGKKDEAIQEGRLLAKGLPAGPGAASGKIAFSTAAVERYLAEGHPAILTRIETSPDDIRGMKHAAGILTQRGGMTSHAALIARQMGKVCVVGCGDIEINYKEKSMKVGDLTLKEGDDISIDGFVGEVINGHIDSRPSSVVRRYLHGETVQGSQSLVIFDKIMEWADHFREIKVYTNADLPEQCKQAIAFGAQGVGLCRTEHMFFGEDRINVVRSMILARTDEARNHALSKLLEMQREDFLGIFSVMDGKAVTIRCI
ncbi:MAG: pyruvate, phosphate dikinase, partial [Leptospiraceae bacterium]|nr:pyruvate, phosphate dikinase [Leptospiraceae bacterium]